MYIIHYTARDTPTIPDNEEEAGTPGDMRKGGFEVRISKEPRQDDAVELINHLCGTQNFCPYSLNSSRRTGFFSLAEVHNVT